MTRPLVLGAPKPRVPRILRWGWLLGLAWLALNVWDAWSHPWRHGADTQIGHALAWFALSIVVCAVGTMIFWHRNNRQAYDNARTGIRWVLLGYLGFRAWVEWRGFVSNQIHDD